MESFLRRVFHIEHPDDELSKAQKAFVYNTLFWSWETESPAVDEKDWDPLLKLFGPCSVSWNQWREQTMSYKRLRTDPYTRTRDQRLLDAATGDALLTQFMKNRDGSSDSTDPGSEFATETILRRVFGIASVSEPMTMEQKHEIWRMTCWREPEDPSLREQANGIRELFGSYPVSWFSWREEMHCFGALRSTPPSVGYEDLLYSFTHDVLLNTLVLTIKEGEVRTKYRSRSHSTDSEHVCDTDCGSGNS